MTTLKLTHVNKTYGENTILHDIDLSIEQGEFAVIIGPSGCGKSTLLRLIAGLESLTSGNILINERCVAKQEPKDRDIAMVFQNYALYPHMTVFDNLAYGLRIRRIAKTEIKARVQETAERLEIQHLLDRYPRELSGGQRQRVAMGRAIIRKPAIFLFDEPLSNLDAKLRVQMRMEIKRLQQQLGITSVYVTHDQVEAMTLADRLIVLNKGNIEQIGSPMDVYNFPASTFVAGFIGSPAMNFVDATINEKGNALLLSTDIILPLVDDSMYRFAGKAVTLGIRPESIFASERQGADHFILNIEMVESLGSDTMVYGKLPCQQQLISARLSGKWSAKPGDTVTLCVMPDSLHLFDVETGMRLLGKGKEAHA